MSKLHRADARGGAHRRGCHDAEAPARVARGRRSYATEDGDWLRVASFATPLSRAEIWAALAEVEAWPVWWEELGAVQIDGPLERGARGRIRLRRLPALRMRVTAAEPGRMLAVDACAGLAQLAWQFTLEDSASGGTRIVERTSVMGPVARCTGRFLDGRIGGDAERSLGRLAALAFAAAQQRIVETSCTAEDAGV